MQGATGLRHLAPSLAAILVPFFTATDIIVTLWIHQN